MKIELMVYSVISIWYSKKRHKSHLDARVASQRVTRANPSRWATSSSPTLPPLAATSSRRRAKPTWHQRRPGPLFSLVRSGRWGVRP